MKDILNQLFEHQSLDYQQSKRVLTEIGIGQYNPSQIAAFLTAFQMRNITVDELKGFRDALQELCLTVDLSDFDPIDLCGTGGDKKNTYNISTLASFVTAGAGIPVAKHGNYGVSSGSGSSNVMEYLGYKFTDDKDKLRKQIEESGICFLHAPLFHPAMKYVAPIRKELGIKTFFNMLGPMVNPAKPKKQIVGVFSLEIARIYSYLYQKSDVDFYIIHALDGYDEISLTGDFKLISSKKDEVFSPKDLGLPQLNASEIEGGATVEEAAKIFLNILNNKSTLAQKQVVAANAAMAIKCAKPTLTFEESVNVALESIESGNALKSFTKLLAV